jgi:hypothetical protein
MPGPRYHAGPRLTRYVVIGADVDAPRKGFAAPSGWFGLNAFLSKDPCNGRQLYNNRSLRAVNTNTLGT